ncbi:10435_t:CDS:1, partial [Entrophospora sp. SA101]
SSNQKIPSLQERRTTVIELEQVPQETNDQAFRKCTQQLYDNHRNYCLMDRSE